MTICARDCRAEGQPGGQALLKRMAQCLLIAAIVVLAACGDKGVPEMNEDEQRTVQAYTDSMIPVCVGRFMVDMPERMELVYSSLTVNDAIVSARPMSRQMFERYIDRQRNELESRETVDPADAPFLKGMEREEDLVMFDRNKREGVPDAERTLEGYRFLDDTMFKVSINATDLSDDRHEKWRAHLTDNKADRMRQVRYLLGRLRPLHRGEIPEEPGVCFEHGFLAIDAQQDIPGHEARFPIERLAMRYIDQERRDVYFNVTTDSSAREETTLLERAPEANQALHQDENGAVLREGEVTLEGIDQAEEWLASQTSPSNSNPIRQNYFRLEANSLQGDRLAPIVMIKFVNGEFVAKEDRDRNIDQASLSDAEAVGVWDAVTRTFRPRPGAF